MGALTSLTNANGRFDPLYPQCSTGGIVDDRPYGFFHGACLFFCGESLISTDLSARTADSISYAEFITPSQASRPPAVDRHR
jgi:hypothetical protein